MFRIIWDKDINGVLLTTNGNGDALNVSPRPVFHEELNLLGFDKNWNWKYPESNEPLLWGLDRRYYYKGELVAEVKEIDLDEPEILRISNDTFSFHIYKIRDIESKFDSLLITRDSINAFTLEELFSKYIGIDRNRILELDENIDIIKERGLPIGIFTYDSIMKSLFHDQNIFKTTSLLSRSLFILQILLIIYIIWPLINLSVDRLKKNKN
jgi:hypothetical protein